MGTPYRTAIRKKWIHIAVLLSAWAATMSAASPDLVLHDKYSLHRAGLDALLLDHHYRTLDRATPWIGAWPAPTLPRQIAPRDTQAYLEYRDSTKQQRAILHPQLALSYRSGLTAPTSFSQGRTDLEASSIEGGGTLYASAPDFHAWGDARISVERQEPFPHSYDGQYIEASQGGDNSVATFTSFARFEGRMTLDTKLGRFGAGRTRQQWGPSLLYPLVLGQESQPYSHIDWTVEWGKVRIRTLWGRLAIDGAGQFRGDTATRSLYAHRYEWAPAPWLSLGATEALVLYQTEEPVAFAPILPLFMMKGQSVENNANGELAFDVNFRPMDGWRMYGEFLIDDMSEPASLFNDFWKNKWAFTLGSHVAFNPRPSLQAGLVTELSRVEPWVYTEYRPNTNQANHQGILLGNQNGPNSLSLGGAGYLVYSGISVSTGLEWVRKGVDSGSAVSDTRPDSSRATKEFLARSKDLLVTTFAITYSLTDHIEARLESSWSLLDDSERAPRSPATLRVGVTSAL